MIILDSTLKSLEVILSGAVTTNQLPIVAAYVDVDQTTFAMVNASENDTQTNNGTAVTAVAAPASGKSRQIKFLSVFNTDTVSATVTIQLNNNSTLRTIIKVTLLTGEYLRCVDSGFTVFNASGNAKIVISGVSLTTDVTGTLPVTSGGTGVATAFTAGSVVFAGASGVYAQDNTNLFWDDSNNRLGVGISTPGTGLEVRGAGGRYGAYDTPLRIKGTTYTYLEIEGTSNQAGFILNRDGSTGFINLLNNSGYFRFSPAASIDQTGVTNAKDGNTGITIDTSGNVGIGAAAPSAQLHTTSTVRFANFGAGTATFDASGNVSSVSDERLKDIQGPFTPGLLAVLGIKPILYRYTAASGLDKLNTYAGFAASNVREYIPEAIGVNVNGIYSLNVIPILAAAVTAVKELMAEIDELRSIVNGVAHMSAMPKNRTMTPVADTDLTRCVRSLSDSLVREE
jgi:hypothetical protein